MGGLHKIYHHEDYFSGPNGGPGQALRDWLAPTWYKYQGGRELPSLAEHAGELDARIEQGRWVVGCPNLNEAGDPCNTSILASMATPFFICVECGSPENRHRWYAVAFPREKAAIEANLLVRPALKSFDAINRNWKPGETLADIQLENAEHGLDRV